MKLEPRFSVAEVITSLVNTWVLTSDVKVGFVVILVSLVVISDITDDSIIPVSVAVDNVVSVLFSDVVVEIAAGITFVIDKL